MKVMLSDKSVELAGKGVLCLAILIYLGSSALSARAQNVERLSREPLIIKVFDPEKNETTVYASVVDPRKGGPYELSALLDDPNPPSLKATRVLYSYPGRNPTRPQSVTFTFIPRDKYQGIVYFSVSADKAVIHQGEMSQEQYTVKSDGSAGSHQEVAVELPIDIFLRLTQAKKVEFKVGPKSYKNTFKLNDYGKKSLALLVGTMEKQSN